MRVRFGDSEVRLQGDWGAELATLFLDLELLIEADLALVRGCNKLRWRRGERAPRRAVVVEEGESVSKECVRPLLKSDSDRGMGQEETGGSVIPRR